MNSNFLVQGGLPGMIPITLFGVAAILLAIFVLVRLIKKQPVSKNLLNSILYLGSMTFFASLLWNAMGLYDILDFIQRNKELSNTAMAAGLKAASVSVIWGGALFFVSYLCWFILRSLKGVQ